MKLLSVLGAKVIELRLYVAGESPNSVRAIANLKAICDDCLPGQHRLEVVDVLEQPLRPAEDGILVTPTLLVVTPGPLQRIIGDLNDRTQVLLALGLDMPYHE
ncbi:MAG: circadian clock protein KaiB [Chthonomonadaceae bacterium]|nr:circadian clock protein KaiB [Chthonomonadaceae bacterium]